MLNQEDFIERLHQIFKHYSLSAAMFADEIKVQRSSISHLLSGRNKPSLEFVLKITNRFKDISFDWLLTGKGSFPLEKETVKPKQPIESNSFEEPRVSNNLFTNVNNESYLSEKEAFKNNVVKIVMFYQDGTFKMYEA